MRRWKRLTLAILILAAIGTAGAVWYDESLPYHFLTVTPGRLYRSGTLAPHHLEEVLDEHGIRTVVSLRTEGEREIGDWFAYERDVCEREGVELVHIPVDEPPSDEHVARWLELVQDEERLPILVHCKHGVIRTAIMVALYEIAVLGKDNREVLDELPLFGRTLDEPKRVHLRDFLLRYKPASPRDGQTGG